MLITQSLWPQPAHAASTPPEILRLTHAEMAYGAGPRPPEQGWRAVLLPEVFSEKQQPGIRTGWYRLGFEMSAPPSAPLVLLVQHVVLTAEFSLNGSLLNPGVHFEQAEGPAGTQMQGWPHWIVLPPGLFRAGHNELLIRLCGDRVTPPSISGISIGPAEQLRGEFLLRDIAQRLVPQALFVMLLVTLVFGSLLWWRERRPLQGQVLVTTVLWLIELGWYLAPDNPLPWRLSVLLISVLWLASHAAVLQLLWRFGGGSGTWFPRLLTIVSALQLVGAGLILILEPAFSTLGYVMLPTILLWGLVTVLMVCWAWKCRTFSAGVLAGSAVFWFAGPLQLLLVVAHLLPPDPFLLTPGSALPLYLVMLRRGVTLLVRERESAAAQRQMAIVAERQRMMLDMHDGIGSQLVTALRLARRDEVPRSDVTLAIQDALHDLRLIVEAQDDTAQDLQGLLRRWQQRNQSRLEAPGTRVQWALDTLPEPRPLSPTEALQVLRILQEALNNALQHSGSRAITIALRPAPEGCELCVSDDGTGIASAQLGLTGAGGHGLKSMRSRAERLGARLEVRSGDVKGTVVSLLLPHATIA